MNTFKSMNKMKNSVAIICAYNPRNTGMYTVDLAATTFFKNLNIDADLYCFQTSFFKDHVASGSLKIKVIRNLNELRHYKSIIFWGDWQNNPVWGLSDFSIREVIRGYASNTDEGFANWLDLYLPLKKGFSQKIYSFGNSFLGITNFLSNISNYSKTQISERFSQAFDFVLPRDHHSYEELKLLFPSIKMEEWGMDLTVLNNFGEINSLKQSSKNLDFSYFFNRSSLHKNNINLIIKNTHYLSSNYPLEIKNWLKISRIFPSFSIRNNFNIISSSQFLITDTYHLALNALNMGTPTILIGENEDQSLHSCCQNKKKILFESISPNLYIEIPKFDENLDAYISNQLKYIFHNKYLFQEQLDNFKNKKILFTNKLGDFLRSL
jgi:hypothetical protein